MDGEAEIVCGFSHRENNGSYKDFLMDVEDLEEAVGSDAEEHSTKRLHQEQNDSLKKKNIQHTGSSGTDDELCGADSSGFLHAHPVCVSQDSWTVRGEEHMYENLLHPCFTAEGSINQRIPGPMFEYLVYLNDLHNVADCPINRPANPPVSPVSVRPHHSTPIPSSLTAISASSPCCSDQNPISAAAHLHLLGESLSLIGRYLQETDKMVCMSSSFSLLLDSLLCAMAPLTGLTVHVPELRSCTQHTMASTLENIAYVMPGL